MDGKVHSFFKSELTELNKDFGFSPMPPYGSVFTTTELDDVIAFLASLRTSTAVLAPEKTDKTNTVFH
jgi:hypothetical protein